jgi:hypothetical protein
MTTRDAPSADQSAPPSPAGSVVAARVSQTAFALVVAGLITVAATGWWSGPWWIGWAVAGVSAVVMNVASRRRNVAFTGDDAARQRGNAYVAGLLRGTFCVCAVVLALLLSRWARDQSFDQHANLRVTAQKGGCYAGSVAVGCHYYYTVNGHDYDEVGPDRGGTFDTTMTLRIDPAHPDDITRAQDSLYLMWLMMIPPLLLGAVTLRVWWKAERRAAAAGG